MHNDRRRLANSPNDALYIRQGTRHPSLTTTGHLINDAHPRTFIFSYRHAKHFADSTTRTLTPTPPPYTMRHTSNRLQNSVHSTRFLNTYPYLTHDQGFTR